MRMDFVIELLKFIIIINFIFCTDLPIIIGSILLSPVRVKIIKINVINRIACISSYTVDPHIIILL